MYLLLSFCIQLAGFYILYNTSSRVVFVKRKWNSWFYQNRFFSKASGSLMLLISLVMFVRDMGIGVGSLFTLISIMTISGFMIILLPLQKSKATVGK